MKAVENIIRTWANMSSKLVVMTRNNGQQEKVIETIALLMLRILLNICDKSFQMFVWHNLVSFHWFCSFCDCITYWSSQVNFSFTKCLQWFSLLKIVSHISNKITWFLKGDYNVKLWVLWCLQWSIMNTKVKYLHL